jgi:hypothetical protein
MHAARGLDQTTMPLVPQASPDVLVIFARSEEGWHGIKWVACGWVDLCAQLSLNAGSSAPGKNARGFAGLARHIGLRIEKHLPAIEKAA